MTDDQFRQIMDAVYALAMRVEEAHQKMDAMRKTDAERQKLLYEWMAPDQYKRWVEAQAEEAPLPEDIRKLLKL